MTTLLVIVFILVLLATTMVGSTTHDLSHWKKRCSYRAKYSSYDEALEALETLEVRKNLKQSRSPGRIGVVSLSVGDREFSKITKKRLEDYCRHHDYDLYYFDEELDSSYSPIWQKCLAIKKVLEMGKNEVIAWFDDDIYITNFEIKLESFIMLAPDKDIILCHDVVKNDPNIYINTGSYFLRNTEISRKFINETIECYDDFSGYFKKARYHEQSIMTYLFYKKYHYYAEVLPYAIVHSFHGTNPWWMQLFRGTHRGWKYKDFSLHLAGVNNDKRLELFTKIKDYDEGQYIGSDWEKVM